MDGGFRGCLGLIEDGRIEASVWRSARGYASAIYLVDYGVEINFDFKRGTKLFREIDAGALLTVFPIGIPV